VGKSPEGFRWAGRRAGGEQVARAQRRVIAVDGKTLRGSAHDGDGGRHLLAAFDQAHGVVHAPYLARRGAHYVVTVKGNQPGLHAQLAALPWPDVPVACQARERGHGRTERRTLKVTAVAKGLAFPHAAQAIQIVRRRKVKAKWSAETCYAVTSLSITQATHAQLAVIIRGPWGSRTACAGSATSTSTKTARRSAPPAAPDHGQPAQPRRHYPTAVRGGQHRRCPAPPRPPSSPATPDDHEVLTTLPGPWLEIPAAELTVAARRGDLADLDQTYGALGTYVAEGGKPAPAAAVPRPWPSVLG
jgi:hypothetical protein